MSAKFAKAKAKTNLWVNAKTTDQLDSRGEDQGQELDLWYGSQDLALKSQGQDQNLHKLTSSVLEAKTLARRQQDL